MTSPQIAMAPRFLFRFLCPLRTATSGRLNSAAGGESDLSRALRRGKWLKILLKLHWMSSAICLLGMILFSLTGVTLNHAAQIEAKPKVVRSTLTLPEDLATKLRQAASSAVGTTASLSEPVAEWLSVNFRVDLRSADAEWSDDEIYFPLPRPGGDAWVRIALEDGKVEREVTDRGWISWLNDLHKGRHTGAVWSFFIDAFAIGCLFFAVTGLLLLKMHAAQRFSTWPLVGLGVIVPVLIALVFIH